MFVTLSTIVSSNRILKIVIAGNLDGLTQTTLAQLDSRLTELPMQQPPVVEFEMGEEMGEGHVEYDHIVAGLPLSRSKDMVRPVLTPVVLEFTTTVETR